VHTSADAFALFQRTPLYRSVPSLLVLIADHSVAIHASDSIPRVRDEWSPRSASGLGPTRRTHLISSCRALVEFVKSLSTQMMDEIYSVVDVSPHVQTRLISIIESTDDSGQCRVPFVDSPYDAKPFSTAAPKVPPLNQLP
jgi:hypothetical protein